MRRYCKKPGPLQTANELILVWDLLLKRRDGFNNKPYIPPLKKVYADSQLTLIVRDRPGIRRAA